MESNISQYKCPNCGGAIPFDAHAQKLVCPHCDTSFDIETLESLQAEESIETDHFGWEEYTGQTMDTNGQTVYVCPSCGGQVIGDETMSASQCPYCGNSVIIQEKFEGLQKPDLVIPFKYTKDDAKKAYSDYLKGKKLLAKDFEAKNIVEKINGLYVPYWLFNADCNCQARFNATRTRAYVLGDYDVQEIDHFMVYRDGTISFSNVPVDGSKKLPAELMESLEPFDFSKGVDFNTAYLSGYFADQYDEPVDEAIKRANERIKNSTYEAISSTVIGYEGVVPTSSNVRFSNGKASYALLPIYIFSTKYNGKLYNFAMNGQTGKFSGDLPADRNRSLKYGLIIFMISFVIILLLLLFLVK